ncbi:hypothetical protein HY792_00705 [Candidatus Desantisbacteria bacterium]|nr:hypothetical protein [Candidatus Desantisbacteria bacterium]
MRYEPLSSFERSLRKLPEEIKEKVKEAIFTLMDFFETGKKSHGLGLKKLGKNLWEIRVDIQIRVIFLLEDDIVKWGFVGDHDQIRQFIKNFR